MAESTVCFTQAFLRLCCRPHWYKLSAPKISEMTMPLIAINRAKNSRGDDIVFESVFLERSTIVNPNIWPTTRVRALKMITTKAIFFSRRHFLDT